MKFKRIISLMLIFVMLLCCSVNVLAINVNVNIDGYNVVQVNTDTNQFFNVTFAPKEWTPDAEIVDTIHIHLLKSYIRYNIYATANTALEMIKRVKIKQS